VQIYSVFELFQRLFCFFDFDFQNYTSMGRYFHFGVLVWA